MRWNWQQPDWPAFAYAPAALQTAEERFLKGAGVVVGAMLHTEGEQKQS
ncbi:MAG TPA: DUF4172 domain-containing protein, partial [Sphingomonas sp.]